MQTASPILVEPDASSFADWLRDELRATREPLRRVTFSVDPLASLAWLEDIREPCSVWQSGEGPLHLGLGIATQVTAAGATRFGEVRARAERALNGAVARSAPGVPERPATFFGGFAFGDGAPESPLWKPFGAARLVCPRWHWVSAPTCSTLSVAVRAEENDPVFVTSLVDRTLELLDEARRASPPNASVREPLRALDVSEAQWGKLVSEALDTLASGEASKVVVARSSEIEFDAALSVTGTVDALGSAYPGCTRFAFVIDGRAFVGATPERLIERRGMRVATEALAGSASGSVTGAAEALMLSDKERMEHAPVLAGIVDALKPLCTELTYPNEPSVRELQDLLHLRTPIEGCLGRSVHVLDLVERLHPTPAVGGVPRSRALSWIQDHEPVERGWYAGPVGWMDEHGNGQFDVALRAGVLQGRRATLYAGAGIVQDSVPVQEYAETRLKFSALRRALRTRADGV